MIFKCKMCGGSLDVKEGESIVTCEYCGTKQTVPTLDNEKIANLYDRASYLRRNNDFDKASLLYEQVLVENSKDAEAYWSIVLCRYGIEYVEDQKTNKRIPTINRAQYESILKDKDYLLALKYADEEAKKLYIEEAEYIDSVQKGILEISNKEEPYDIFICYKETDNNGRRTIDSVLAQDIYKQLTNEGYKVFFSRITLEDKLGSAYEPYIFAALNSAKVMLVIGTNKDNFNAVWVKNEWSRYLALINKGNGKTLIPCYKDMNPYDMPEEFSYLQGQDMSKIGFVQDLVYGIGKICNISNTKKASVNKQQIASENGLLQRAFIFAEDGKWQEADNYCEKVLDIDPTNAEAYLCKLMINLKVNHREQLSNCDKLFIDNPNYIKVIRFGNAEINKEIKQYLENIKQRNENARLNAIYNNAYDLMSNAKTEDDFVYVAELFKSISNYKDSEFLMKQSYERAKTARQNSSLHIEHNVKHSKGALILFTLIAFACISLFLILNNKPNVDETTEVGGNLVIYTPNSDALCEVAYTFGEKYGITVDIVSAGTGECLERIVAEKDNPQGDVLYGGMNYANSYNEEYAPLFLEYTAAGDDKLPEAYQNFNGITTHYCLDGSAALLVNIDEYAKLGLDIADFDSYEDLLQPELKGKIAMGDPANSSSAWAELTNMLLVMGNEAYDDAAWEWVGKFIDNLDGVMLSSSSAIYKGVVAGEYVVGVSYEDPCVSLLVDGATNVKLVYPSEGAVWLPAGSAIIKGCQNEDNAKLFMDWLISDEGQAEIAKTTARPVDPSIANTAEQMTPFSEINVVYEDMALCETSKKDWQAKWTEMFNSVQ